MRVCLTTMPWQSLDTPSLPVSILAAAARDTRAPRHEVEIYYGNLAWAEYVLERTAGEITPDAYRVVAEHGLFHGVGDWIFTSSLYPGATWPVERYEAHPATPLEEDGPARVMRELAPAFVRSAAEHILATDPDVVGLSSTFMQNVPSLALATELKRLRPSTQIVMGGGNCEAPMGPALHRNFLALDYVVCGEGEVSLVGLLDAIEAGAAPEVLRSIPGLCWRAGETTSVNPTAPPLSMDAVPAAAFEAYFDALESGPVAEFVEPRLLHEAARGCWWGQRKHCTFCGLNGSTMAFRSKSPERVFNELARDVRRHRVLDVVMVDNIMDNAYVGSLLPQLAAADWDLRIHYEVKSNLRRRDLEAMRGAGVVHIQPGIESLSTRVLGLMGKGVDATTNVGVLRDCEELSITASWNYLYGFPAEEDSDYLSVIERMPDLYHLQPPDGTTRIVLERFSPYHRDPELGFAIRRPASFYRHVYDLPDRELRDLVYAFDTPTAGITSDVEGALLEATDVWHDAYPTSTLTCQRVGDELVITDRRAHRAPADHVLDEEWQVACYGLLERGRGAASLARALRERELEPPSPETLADWLASLQERGLVFPDGDRFVALATSGVPQRARVAASP